MKTINNCKTIFDFPGAGYNGREKFTLNLSAQRLLELIEKPEYSIFRIPKKNGGSRIIHSPCCDLMKIQKTINYYLQNEYSQIKPECVHGFVAGKGKDSPRPGIYSNAFPHTGKAFVLNIDISKFFPAIKAASVKSILMNSLHFNDNVASVITQLCTFEKQLPTGAPTSPVLSNFYCYVMDLELTAYADAGKLTYTRYADDLSFSSDTAIEPEIIENIKNLLNKFGFTINKRKFRMKNRQQCQMVTGLVVNEKVSVNRRYKRKLRAIVYDIKRNGFEPAARKHYKIKSAQTSVDVFRFQQKINGMKGFVKGIENKKTINDINK